MKRLFFVVLVLACKKEETTGTVVGPPLVGVPASSSVASASATPTPSVTPPTDPLPPVNAQFVDIGAAGYHTMHVACEQRITSVVSGKLNALGETLGPGDLFITQGKGEYDIKGSGTIVFAIARGVVCEPNQFPKLEKKVILAKTAPLLTWADGKMHAHLDAEKENAPYTYVGRLDGTASVAEHQHDGSWEILCAIDAKGTFTLAGKEQRLGPKTCLAVPPSTKHAWKPDDGSALSAVQFYSPSGPEQRFKALAGVGAR